MGDGTEIGTVRGLGSAHEGAHHWVLQRYTAVGNLLTLTFLGVSLALMPNYQIETIRDWMVQPAVTLVIALMIVSVFWHAKLGLQVMIEDYVTDPGRRFATLLVLNLAAFAGAAAGLMFLLRIVAGALGAQAAEGALSEAMAAAMGGRGGM